MEDKKKDVEDMRDREERIKEVLDQNISNLKKVGRYWIYPASIAVTVTIATLLYGGTEALRDITQTILVATVALSAGCLAFALFAWLQSPGKPARSPEARQALTAVINVLIGLAIIGLSAGSYFLI